MGMPMATNLARAGVALSVHDASPAAQAAAGQLSGARVAGSPSQVAGESDVVFTCLPNDDIVRRVYLGPAGLGAGARPGLVTCDCSTVSPEATVEVAAGMRERGSVHMDTPMLGWSPRPCRARTSSSWAATPPRCRPSRRISRSWGDHMFVGGPGMANRVKLLHNGLAAVTSVAVAEALGVCVQSGVDPTTFYEVVRNGGGMAFGTYFDRRVKRMIDGEWSPTFMLELMRKDATLALALARSVKVPVPILEGPSARTTRRWTRGGASRTSPPSPTWWSRASGARSPTGSAGRSPGSNGSAAGARSGAGSRHPRQPGGLRRSLVESGPRARAWSRANELPVGRTGGRTTRPGL